MSTNYNLPLPHISHTLAEDVENIRNSLVALDAALATVASSNSFAQDKQNLLDAIAQVRTDAYAAIAALDASTAQSLNAMNGMLANFEQAIKKNKTLALAGL